MRADPLPVTDAAQAAARDAAAIAAGTHSFALMLAAGTAITEVILRRADARLSQGVLVCAGPGNNGGDGYVVAAQLARLGVPVRVWGSSPPRTPDARRAEALARDLLPAAAFLEALPAVPEAVTHGDSPGLVVDALLGTGTHGALRGDVLRAAGWISAMRALGTVVVAADVPTGLHASTGAVAEGCVHADVTVCLGTCKAGVLAARSHTGDLVVVDIELAASAQLADGAPLLADPAGMVGVVPRAAWNAHKGTRGHVLLVGGARGMAGAMHLAARGALLSGAGLVRASVAWETLFALQASVPEMVCLPPERRASAGRQLEDDVASSHHSPLESAATEWAHCVVLGPGLGRNADAADRLERTLRAAGQGTAALVLDADALTLLASGWAQTPAGDAFRACANAGTVVLTPHWGEFRRLAAAVGVPIDGATTDLQARLGAVRQVAGALNATVLLKGTPTICSGPRGDAWMIPRGSPALASGGAGDVLSGVIGALLAGAFASQGTPGTPGSPGSPAVEHAPIAALCAAAAWVHGVAGEQVFLRTGGVRGTAISDVVDALPAAWRAWDTPEERPPRVLLALSAPEGPHARR